MEISHFNYKQLLTSWDVGPKLLLKTKTKLFIYLVSIEIFLHILANMWWKSLERYLRGNIYVKKFEFRTSKINMGDKLRKMQCTFRVTLNYGMQNKAQQICHYGREFLYWIFHLLLIKLTFHFQHFKVVCILRSPYSLITLRHRGEIVHPSCPLPICWRILCKACEEIEFRLRLGQSEIWMSLSGRKITNIFFCQH